MYGRFQRGLAVREYTPAVIKQSVDALGAAVCSANTITPESALCLTPPS
ncbi:MAG: hypothetical protein LBG87_02715 [Spirochaetaceae bacterium]|nr:hypothetical protein [Spirochaetaceae bacterium]